MGEIPGLNGEAMWTFFKDCPLLLTGPILGIAGFILCFIRRLQPYDMRRTLAWCCAAVPALTGVLLASRSAPLVLLLVLLLTAAIGLGVIASVGYFVRSRRPGSPKSRPLVPSLLLVASVWDMGAIILSMRPDSFGVNY